MTTVFYIKQRRSDADLQAKLDEAFAQGLSVGDSDNTEAAYDRGFEAGKRVTAEHLTATKLAEMKAQRDDAIAAAHQARNDVHKSYNEGFSDGRRGMVPEGEHLEVPDALELGGFEERSKLLDKAYRTPLVSMTGEELHRLVGGVIRDVKDVVGVDGLRAEILCLRQEARARDFPARVREVHKLGAAQAAEGGCGAGGEEPRAPRCWSSGSGQAPRACPGGQGAGYREPEASAQHQRVAQGWPVG